MNATELVKKVVNIPKPQSFTKKPLSDLANQLLGLAIYDDALDNELILPVEGDPGKFQSRIHQAAKSKSVKIVVSTRHDSEQNVIRVYRAK
jgi:hypothetical protein